MIFHAVKTGALITCIGLIACASAGAQCSVDTVIVQGRVEHAPPNASVRVRLVYPKDQLGESAEATVENEAFSIPVEFLTQSRRPVLIGSLAEKCDRKPKTVVVTLVQRDHDREYDRVSLELAKDFKMIDKSAYSLRSEIVLQGSR
jgi:hypothetical protein